MHAGAGGPRGPKFDAAPVAVRQKKYDQESGGIKCVIGPPRPKIGSLKNAPAAVTDGIVLLPLAVCRSGNKGMARGETAECGCSSEPPATASIAQGTIAFCLQNPAASGPRSASAEDYPACNQAHWRALSRLSALV